MLIKIVPGDHAQGYVRRTLHRTCAEHVLGELGLIRRRNPEGRGTELSSRK